MVRRNPSTAAASSSTASGTALAFGGTTKNVHLPSGTKLVWSGEDEDAILKFMGSKDITDKVPDAQEQGKKVIYVIAHDGKRLVSMPSSFAFTDFEMEKDHYYYLHLDGLVPTGQPSPMKDFNIVDLGLEGQKVPVTSDRLPGISEITLTLADIKKLNYEMLNYPLRKV